MGDGSSLLADKDSKTLLANLVFANQMALRLGHSHPGAGLTHLGFQEFDWPATAGQNQAVNGANGVVGFDDGGQSKLKSESSKGCNMFQHGNQVRRRHVCAKCSYHGGICKSTSQVTFRVRK